MRYFISKYALTVGIKERELRPSSSDPNYLYPADGGWTPLKLGRDAFETREEAVAAANAARDKKVASLRKQLAKLEKLAFE